MRKSLMVLVAAAFALAFATGPVAADWTPADDYKMQFPQLPDEDGWDVKSSGNCRVADDFQCAETGCIKDIYFWGSWRADLEQEPAGIFQFRIYSNDPGPPSKPDNLLWWYEVRADDPNVTIVFIGPNIQGWFDPCDDWFAVYDHAAYYQYNVILPEPRWFCQDEGVVYWLEIYRADVPFWGWKTADVLTYPLPYTGFHFMDDAVYDSSGVWVPLEDPILPEVSLDMAFVLTGDPVPPQVPTLSQWGLMLLVLLLAVAGAVALIRRRAVARAA